MAVHDPRASSDGARYPSAREEKRLGELYALHILDTPPEVRFDRLTMLTATCLAVPRVLVGLMDEERQWLKAAHGIECAELPRYRTLCERALWATGVTAIADLQRDPSGWGALAAQTHPGFRAYMAVPLQSASGLPLGTLTVLDRNPRTFGPRERKLLETLGELVQAELYRPPGRVQPFMPGLETARCGLTGLHTRQSALPLLNEMLEDAAHQGHRLALVIADIADFKAINSAFGRDAGDWILRQAAQRLVVVSPNDGMVFRFQGDQFALAVPLADSGSRARLEDVIGGLAKAMEAPIDLDGHPVSLHLVFGTAVYPNRASNTPELLDRAILALRRAQEQHTAAEVFTTDLEDRWVREVTIEQTLRAGLAEGRVAVVYQPKVNLRTGRICSLEALCRLSDPDRGPISPSDFIPAAERTGLIYQLGGHVLRTALADVQRLRNHIPGLSVSVNVSAAQLRQTSFATEVEALLEASGAPAEALELEVVETSVIENMDRAAAMMRRLRARGVAFSLDDFGTGYSSLAYLHRLPVDSLKIDRSFVQNMTESQRDAALVASIISMAQVLEFRVVAEGVETEEQARMLSSFGCDVGQGFLWARPMSLEPLLEKLKAWTLRPVGAESTEVDAHGPPDPPGPSGP